MVDTLATTVFLLNAYFFVFEMKIVHEFIRAKSYTDSKTRERRTKKIRNIFMIVAASLHMAFLAILIFRYILMTNNQDSLSSPYYVFFMIFVVIRLLMDGFIFHTTASYFYYVATKRLSIIK
jgi:hypothetical protein